MIEAIKTYFETIPSLHRALILAGGISFFWIIESALPLFQFKYNKTKHAALNIFFTFTTIAINFAFALIMVKASDYVVANGWGLLQFVKMPLLLELIIGLMLLFPTRRPVDYRKMLVVNSKPNIKDKNNYYFNNQFYFNITKNKDIQQFVVPEHLDLLIKNVIDKRQIDNNYLLLNENNKQFSSSGLSIFIMKTFQKIYNISISAVEIRRFYSTYLKNEVANGNLTEQEHRDISYKMNHSYEENKKYAY